MRLTVGPQSYDLTSRAVVVDAKLASVADDASLDRALSAGTALVHLPRPTGDGLRRCAAAGVAVVVPPGAVPQALEAGLPLDRVVPDTLLLDVTGSDCEMAAIAVGVIRGARIVRTADVRAAQRICDVLAAVLEAR
jgi:hypothetical protein